MPDSQGRVGRLIGLLVFLGGIGLLVFVFQHAFTIFTNPPRVALGLDTGKPLNLNQASETLATLIIRIAMLLVMCIVGAVITNRGIKMYATGGGHIPVKHPHDEPKEPKTA